MRNPNNVLNSLSKHSNHKEYKYERVYRLLFNEEMYYTRQKKTEKREMVSKSMQRK